MALLLFEQQGQSPCCCLSSRALCHVKLGLSISASRESVIITVVRARIQGLTCSEMVAVRIKLAPSTVFPCSTLLLVLQLPRVEQQQQPLWQLPLSLQDSATRPLSRLPSQLCSSSRRSRQQQRQQQRKQQMPPTARQTQQQQQTKTAVAAVSSRSSNGSLPGPQGLMSHLTGQGYLKGEQ